MAQAGSLPRKKIREHIATHSPTNQEDWPSVGTIASTLAQYSAIYGNTLGQFSWFVGSV